MNIRLKLTLQFTLTIALILAMFSFVVYSLSSGYRKNDFYSRLHQRATSNAKLLLDVSEVDGKLLKIIDNNLYVMYRENLQIFDSKDSLVYESGQNGPLYKDKARLSKIRREKQYRYNQEGREFLGLLFNSGKAGHYVVISSAYDEFGYRKLRNLRFVLTTGTLAGLVLALLGGYIFAGRALRPISEVVKEVQNISESNLNARVYEGNGKDEIALLAITFNQMLSRLEYAFSLQKSFVSNASHEFRTPISIMRAEIELLMMQERTVESYEKTLVAIKHDLDRLTHLSNSLLDLAQANQDWSLLKLSPLRADELVLQARAELNRKDPEYAVNIEFGALPDDDMELTMMGHEYLLDIAISNLMENACKFSPDKRVVVGLSSVPHEIVIIFEDQGIGMSTQEQSMIFEPFFRGSNAIDKPGHGLGMSLVKRIVEIHGGEIEFKSALGKGTTFTLRFPSVS